jgi:hypothetical protein
MLLQGSGVGSISAIGTSRTHGPPDCLGLNRYLGMMVALPKFGAKCAPRLKDGRNC